MGRYGGENFTNIVRCRFVCAGFVNLIRRGLPRSSISGTADHLVLDLMDMDGYIA
jgi:hypothetical protein